jgi:hypothetical protein
MVYERDLVSSYPCSQKTKNKCLERQYLILPRHSCARVCSPRQRRAPRYYGHECTEAWPCRIQPLALSSQSVCSTEDMVSLLELHIGALGDGNIDNLFLELEDEQILIWYVPTSKRFRMRVTH